MSWNNGYVSDIEYPAGFFHAQSPMQLNFACLMHGYEPVAPERAFTYCELGCGQGFTANVLAASNPHGRFYAFDFNPAHVAVARALADEAGLDNLTVLENSFADLVEGKVDLPQFDFVTMYGVYGWVNEENRQYIVDFLVRYVKPGGIVYVNYNTMPGWAAMLPLQRLMVDYGDMHAGGSLRRYEQARQLVDRLVAVQARYFDANTGPDMTAHLDVIRHASPGYLAHEYMNRGGQAHYHRDVARQLAAAKLDYVGSAELFRAFPYLSLTPQQQKLLDTVPSVMRETVADYLQNTPFRQDVYVRGARPLTLARQKEWMSRIGLALTVPRAMVKYQMDCPSGVVIDRRDLYEPVLDALEKAPCTLAELGALPALAQETTATVYEIAALLITSGQACGYGPDTGAHNAPARAMNQAIALHSRYDKRYHAFASPLAGTGINVDSVMRRVYRVLCEPGDVLDAGAVASRVWDMMVGEGYFADTAGQRFTEDEEGREALAETVHTILKQHVPLWRQLKVL